MRKKNDSSRYKPEGKKLIFRRYRKLPNGQVLDARKYGLKAWPIWVDVDPLENVGSCFDKLI